LGIFIISCQSVTTRLNQFVVHGIDVSHYQGRVDWNKIEQQEIHFAFAKATEGGDHIDSLFAHNWKEMRRIGIKKGAYHFYRTNVDPKIQAENFMDQVQLFAGDLAPVLDVELIGNVSKEKLQTDVRIWLETVEERYGVKPILYSNQEFFLKNLMPFIDQYPTWIARYSSEAPLVSYKTDWNFWQYGDRGKVDGIDTNVDLNVFQGGLRELENFCLPTEQIYSLVFHNE